MRSPTNHVAGGDSGRLIFQGHDRVKVILDLGDALPLGQAVQSFLHGLGGEPAVGYSFLAKEGVTSFGLKAVDPMFQRLRHFEASRRSAKRDRNYPFMQTIISANLYRFNDKAAIEKRTLARTLNSNKARPNGAKARKWPFVGG